MEQFLNKQESQIWKVRVKQKRTLIGPDYLYVISKVAYGVIPCSLLHLSLQGIQSGQYQAQPLGWYE